MISWMFNANIGRLLSKHIGQCLETMQVSRAGTLLPDDSVDAAYGHMLFNMTQTTTEITSLREEVLRVLRPGGWHIYTVRHRGDSHSKKGACHGN